MKRAALLVLLIALGVAGVAAAYAFADSPPPSTTTGTTTTDSTTTTTTPTTTAPTPPPPPAKRTRIAAGVTISGIHVAGLTYGAAASAVAVVFRSPLELDLGDHVLLVSPWKLGAKPFIGPAVSRALKAKPNTAVKLVVDVKRAAVDAYVDKLAKLYDRKVSDARVVLRALRPKVIPEVEGSTIQHSASVTAIVHALQQTTRGGSIELPAKLVEPQVTADSFSSIIVIRRDSKWLYLYKQVTVGKPVAFVRRFIVATGQAIYPTPTGSFKIVVMERNPWWYPPPDAPWAKGAKPIPPGPGNPLGTRWMGLSAPGVGIHGTPDPA